MLSVQMLSKRVVYSRRVTPRTEADDEVHVFWYSHGRGDLSRVRNLNLGGIFIETRFGKELGTPVELYFLEGEGHIHAKAIVSHVEPGQGMGLKFTVIHEQDRLHFGSLMSRLYSASKPINSWEQVKAGR
jgi:hypothetical protein